MKKIGILTFHNTINYGGVLQCYALQEFLKELNYEVEIINYDSENIKKHNRLVFVNGYKTNINIIVKNLILFFPNSIRKIKYKSFINKKLNLSKKVTQREFSNFCNNKYDIVIVGSDQVWNSELIKNEEDIYFLKDIKIPKLSYAASIGNNNTLNEKSIVNFTKDYLNVSIREVNTVKSLKDKYGYEATCNVDPTLLLNKEKWRKLISKEDKVENNLLLYILEDNEKIKKISIRLKEEYNLNKIETFSKKSFGIENIKRICTSGPNEFIEKFNCSKIILTNSFHGTVFSIIFNKEFYVLLPKKRQERIISLLEKLKLENRIIRTDEDLDKIINKKINYSEIDNILKAEIKESQNYFERMEN